MPEAKTQRERVSKREKHKECVREQGERERGSVFGHAWFGHECFWSRMWYATLRYATWAYEVLVLSGLPMCLSSWIDSFKSLAKLLNDSAIDSSAVAHAR